MTSVEASNKLKNMLNTKCVDPFPGTRIGTQFYNEMDGTPNLNRANTFPKGYIFETDDYEVDTKSFHTSGWAVNKQQFTINYFVKDRISYTPDSDKLTEHAYLIYMREQIKQTLLDNKDLLDGYMIQVIKLLLIIYLEDITIL